MTDSGRRRFIQSTSFGVAGLAAGATLAGTAARAQSTGRDVDAMAAQISALCFAIALKTLTYVPLPIACCMIQPVAGSLRTIVSMMELVAIGLEIAAARGRVPL